MNEKGYVNFLVVLRIIYWIAVPVIFTFVMTKYLYQNVDLSAATTSERVYGIVIFALLGCALAVFLSIVASLVKTMGLLGIILGIVIFFFAVKYVPNRILDLIIASPDKIPFQAYLCFGGYFIWALVNVLIKIGQEG